MGLGRKLAFALLSLSLPLLTSCDSLAFDTESLLQPPLMNNRQQQVYTALESTLSSTNIVYKYPQRGEHRSPFVFWDMDGDDWDEAVVFYSYQDDPGNTRAQILYQNEDGSWESAHDFTTNCDQVEFVQFSHMLSEESYCMIVGWSTTVGQLSRYTERYLSVYSIENGEFTPEVPPQSYLAYTVGDFNADNLEEIVLIEQDSNRNFMLSLLRPSGSHIIPTSSVALSPDADAILSMVSGRLWDGSQAVYIDETTFGSFSIISGEEDVVVGNVAVATEIFRIGPRGLEALVSGSREDMEEGSPAWEKYGYTFREQEGVVLCMDVDGDGQVEVPSPVNLPGFQEDAQAVPLSLTSLMHLTADGFWVQDYCVINSKENYLVYYPARWTETVTVVIDESTDEWKFFVVDADTGEPTVELLRIQASTSPEAVPNDESGLIHLGSRGMRHYTGYIPRTTGESLAISENELRAMFLLL